MERYERNQTIATLRSELAHVTEAAVELALPAFVDGAEVAPKWSGLALLTVVGEVEHRKDGAYVVLRQEPWGDQPAQKVADLLRMGYRVKPREATPA